MVRRDLIHGERMVCVLLWLNEFSGVVLSCFTLFRSTIITKTTHKTGIPLFKAIHFLYDGSGNWTIGTPKGEKNDGV